LNYIVPENENYKIIEVLNENRALWFEKYSTQYRNEFQTYVSDWESRNEIIIPRNKINSALKLNGVKLGLNDLYPSLRFVNNGHSIDNVDLFQSFLLRSTLSSQIKNDLSFDQKVLFYELSFKYYLKRYFILGGMDWYISYFFYIYRNGYDAIKKHCSSSKWLKITSELKNWIDGKYSTDNRGYLLSLYSSITTQGTHFENVWLASFTNQDWYFKEKKNAFDYSLGSYLLIPDNIQFEDFVINPLFVNEYLNCYQGPENELRTLMGLPRIGEGWITETKLYYRIKEEFKNTIVHHHGKPKWLHKQHLDIFLPEYNIAVEYQGLQHYQPIEYFGGEAAFQKNQQRDFKKKDLCEKNGCHLICIKSEAEFNYVILEIKKIISL
jgi:hypothetical protein